MQPGVVGGSVPVGIAAEAGALDIRFLADHVRVRPDGGHGRRVTGTPALGPLQPK